MPPGLQALADAQGGPFTAAQALAHGVDRGELHRLLRRRQLVRLRRGVYVEASRAATDGASLHSLHLRGLGLVMTAPAVISHESAAVVHGIQMLDPDLGFLHVSRADLGSSRVEAGVRHHAASLPAAHLTTVDGRAVTTIERTAVDLARTRSLPGAVVAVDAALRSGGDLDEVRRILFFCASWNGSRTAGRAVAFADPGAESVGESLCRLLLVRSGLPTPRSQVEIVDGQGFVGRVDFCFEDQRTVVEFDGRAKYGAESHGRDPLDVLWREKRREDRIRGAGYEVVRVAWADLDRPDEVRARVLAAFGRAARRSQASG